MLHFTDNQKLILDELKQRPDATNTDLMVLLNVKMWMVRKEIDDLRQKLGVFGRHNFVSRAEAAGWRSSHDEANTATVERHVTRLVADSFPDGPLKPMAIKAESLHHEVANMATQFWGECELQTPVTMRLLDRFSARMARTRALLNQLDSMVDEARKTA